MMTQCQTNPMHQAALNGAVNLIAIDAEGKVIKNGPRVSAKPENWNDGHPTGALLEKDFDFDAGKLTEPMKVHGWLVQGSARQDLGKVFSAAPTVIEPQSQMRLSRVIVIPRASEE